METTTTLPERQPLSPLTLSSNNPFRNRATSPALPSPQSATTPGGRPMSNNPFLAASEQPAVPAAVTTTANAGGSSSSPKKSPFDSKTVELFDNLNLDDKPLPPNPNGPSRVPPQQQQQQRSDARPSTGHRPTHSDEQRDPRRGPGPRGPPRARGPPGHGSPNRSGQQHRPRPRRNSDTSVMEKTADDDKRRKEREARHRDKDRSRREGRSDKTRRPRGLDVIDKLDVTGIYGPSSFHHDGPFDACNPHRNRKNNQRAPMQAFPVGSANNVLGGSGPINPKFDYDRFHGRGEEAFVDYQNHAGGRNEVGRYQRTDTTRQPSFNPKDRSEMVHGEESMGLGTSTFLEGAPASKTAMQRRESDAANAAVAEGLQRKKSLAQRLRGISQPRRPGFDGPGGPTRIAAGGPRGPYSPTSPNAPTGTVSAGGTSKMNSDRNPFFEDYDDAYEKKGASIKVSEAAAAQESEEAQAGLLGGGSRARAPSFPKPLVRSVTTDDGVSGSSPSVSANAGLNGNASGSGGGGGGAPGQANGGGFLSRVRSMKGSKGRARSEVRAA